MLIGEIYLPLERLVAYYGTDLEGVHLPFNFQLLQSRVECARASPSSSISTKGVLPDRRLAQLGAGQPRQSAHRFACRR